MGGGGIDTPLEISAQNGIISVQEKPAEKLTSNVTFSIYNGNDIVCDVAVDGNYYGTFDGGRTISVRNIASNGYDGENGVASLYYGFMPYIDFETDELDSVVEFNVDAQGSIDIGESTYTILVVFPETDNYKEQKNRCLLVC